MSLPQQSAETITARQLCRRRPLKRARPLYVSMAAMMRASRRKGSPIFPPLPSMDELLFPAGGHFLAALAPRTEIFLAIRDRRRTFADDFGLEIGDDRFDLALLQARSRVW